MTSPDLAQGELAHTDEEIIIECQTRYSFANEAEGSNRSEYEFDKRFVSGDQWDPTVRDERFSDRRPCLTVNITDAICRRVINACRENRPRIVVHPVGNGADIQTAKVHDGLIRHIEYASNAAYAYDVAVENAVHGGWGWIGLDADYVSDNTFDQELKITAWPNPLMIYGDPNSRQPDGSDMDWVIETHYMKRTEYKERFGSLDEAGWRWSGKGDDVPDWSNKEEIRIAKYWRVEREEDELLKLSDGTSILRSRIKDKRLDQLGLTIIAQRPVYRRQVRCYLLTAKKILEKRDWPGKWIPRVPVYGRRLDLNGRMELKGMVRDLRDPARIYNYVETRKTENYAMTPIAQWIMPEHSMEGHEAAWRDTNRKPIVALEFKPQRDEAGNPLPPPQRIEQPQPNQAFLEWGQSTKSDFLLVAGMPHDPDADKKGEVVSGIALKRRQGLADISNFDFYDNLTRSLRHLGKIIIDLVPHYYDTRRTIRIIQEDGTPEVTKINEPAADPMSSAVFKIMNDMTIGDYEVVVDTGPSYQTKREESAEALLEMMNIKGIGEMIAQTAGDKVIRAMDFADADGVADRVMAMIPAAQMEAMKGLPPKAQALVSGLQAQVKQMQQQLMAAHLELKTKAGIEQVRQQGETQRLQMKEAGAHQREQMKAHVSMHDTHVKAVTAHDVAEISVAGKLLDSHAAHGHEAVMAANEMLHDSAMARSDRESEAADSQADREFEGKENEADREHESTEASAGREHESSEADAQRTHERETTELTLEHQQDQADRDRGAQHFGLRGRPRAKKQEKPKKPEKKSGPDEHERELIKEAIEAHGGHADEKAIKRVWHLHQAMNG